MRSNEKNSFTNGEQNNKIKNALFDEESDGNDDETYNFEIKQQFEGESGRKVKLIIDVCFAIQIILLFFS